MVSLLPQISKQPPITKTSIFYINDEHSQVGNMEKLKTAADEFSSSSTPANKLIFSSGDFDLGSNIPLNKLAVTAQNAIGIMASAGGNHEFDLLKKDLVSVLKNNNYKLLGINVEIPETTEVNKELKKEITSSYIQEENGSKYGVIGIVPPDFFEHVTDPKEYSDFKILSIDETAPLVQKEIDKMKEQGVNKIIILSHAGYANDVCLAKSVEGIDVILGGHTHDLLEGIQEGKNLFYSKKTGEPTIITQAGKNGKYFGVLNLEFNDKGVITKAQNNINKTENFIKSPIMEYLTNAILGKPQIIGKINSVEPYKFSLVNENPNANFINDAVRDELDVDISLINAANLRANFEVGNLTDRALFNLTPFKNNMCIFKLTEKELVDAIKNGAKSILREDNMPGIAQFSGIRYTIDKQGNVKEVYFVDKNGQASKIDVNNPNPFKTYRVAADSYVAKGGNGYISNKWDTAEKTFNFDKDTLAIDYVKKSNKTIDIKTDGRIQIVD